MKIKSDMNSALFAIAKRPEISMMWGFADHSHEMLEMATRYLQNGASAVILKPERDGSTRVSVITLAETARLNEVMGYAVGDDEPMDRVDDFGPDEAPETQSLATNLDGAMAVVVQQVQQGAQRIMLKPRGDGTDEIDVWSVTADMAADMAADSQTPVAL